MQAPPPCHAGLDAFLASVERRALRRAELATRDRDEALDLVQDSMLQLARSYAARPEEEWPPLFQRILTNRIRDWQRRRTVRRRLFFWHSDTTEAADADADPLSQVVDPDAAEGAGQLQQEQTLSLLAAALDALPRRQREAFELRVWEGMSVAATASAMGCSAGSVKTHLSRALEALRGKLEGAQS